MLRLGISKSLLEDLKADAAYKVQANVRLCCVDAPLQFKEAYPVMYLKGFANLEEASQVLQASVLKIAPMGNGSRNDVGLAIALRGSEIASSPSVVRLQWLTLSF